MVENILLQTNIAEENLFSCQKKLRYLCLFFN